MNDISNQTAIADGNARMRAVRENNERIKQHNTDVANQISAIKDQIKTTDRIKEAQDTAQNLWTGAKMPSKIKAFQDYMNSKKSSNPTTQAENELNENANDTIQTSEGSVDRATGELTPTEPPAEANAEGALESVSETEANTGGRIMNGLKSTGAFSDETLETMSKVGGKVATGAGVLGAGAIAGIDIYQDIKAKGIAGNNNWEKAGNLLQIGGAITDVGGAFFPPLALVGGVLDLTAGALDMVGEAEDTSADDKEDKIQQQETEQTQAESTITQTASGDIS
jgi:hypothetical protein